MSTQLPVELYLASRAVGSRATEQICIQATQRSAQGVVAVSVSPADVARAADLLFGTGVGVVSAIDDPGTSLIDQVRHSVASGATEIALPRLVLDDPMTLARIRGWLGPGTPLTIDLSETPTGPDLDAAADILRLGADFVSFAPAALSPQSHRDMLELITFASDLGRGGVKIPVWPLLNAQSPCPGHGVTRLRVPVTE